MAQLPYLHNHRLHTGYGVTVAAASRPCAITRLVEFQLAQSQWSFSCLEVLPKGNTIPWVEDRVWSI